MHTRAPTPFAYTDEAIRLLIVARVQTWRSHYPWILARCKPTIGEIGLHPLSLTPAWL